MTAPIHMKKFMKGRMTPAEAHRALGVRKRCAICAQPAAIRIRVFVPLKEMMEMCPDYVAGIVATNPDGPYVPTFPMKGSDGKPFQAMKISDVGACGNCRVTAEREAAKGPSWAIVEIDRQGLESSHTFAATQVPGNIR